VQTGSQGNQVSFHCTRNCRPLPREKAGDAKSLEVPRNAAEIPLKNSGILSWIAQSPAGAESIILTTMPTTYAHHFRRNVQVLHTVAKRVGPCQLKPNRDRFGMLVRSIISQQISVGAARAIRGRLENLAGAGGIRPETLAALTLPQLRSAGLSPQKASYIHDLAEKVVGGEVQLSQIGRLSDEAIIESLTQVKGIGRWTAQMFLIFALGRPDVFPIDDFGVRVAIARLYGLSEPPPRPQLLEIGAAWSPFASIGSWYCWRYLDLCKADRTAEKVRSA
jgi:DNA-3-methyladenine glycosylase II